MRKILVLFLLCFSAVSFCQEKNIYDTAAEKMCAYIGQHSDQTFATQQDTQMFFAEAFLEVCMPYIDRLLAVEGLETFDEASGKKIGVKIGMKLALMCPDYLKVMRPVMKNEINQRADEAAGTLRGTVAAVMQDDYTYIRVKLDDGSLKRLVLLTYFKEAENFNNDPQQLVDKKVSLEWKQVQLYFRKSHSFSTEKIITAVRLQ